MGNKIKKLLLAFFMLVISISAFSLNVKLANAACYIDLEFRVSNGGVTTLYPGQNNIKANPGNSYALVYSVKECQSAASGRYYKLTSSIDGKLADGDITSSTPNVNNAVYDLGGTPAPGNHYLYTLSVVDSISGQNILDPVISDITFIAGDSNPTPTPSPSSAYTPTEVSVCKLDKTTATICWKTASPSNSEVEYGEQGVDPKVVRFTNFTLTTHSVPLSNLKVATAYRFRARSSPNANTTASTSDWLSFTTKNADGTGGSTGGTGTGTGTGTTNTTVNTYQNYDSVTGTLDNPLKANSIPELITRLIRILLLLIAMVAVVMIIIGGFRMVASGGSLDAIAKGRKTITWAVIGLVVALLSFSIVAIIQNLIQTR